MWIRLLLLATVFWVGTGFSAPTEGNQLVVSGDSERMDLQLGAYMEEIVPGDEREYVVEVSNPTERDIAALLYMADAIPALDGGKDFTLPDDPDIGAAAWFTTPDRSITLRAGETQRFMVKLRFPYSVQPGQHVAVIGIYEDQNHMAGVQVILNYKLDEAKPPQAVPHSVSYALEKDEAFLSILVMNEGGNLSKPEMAVRVKRQNEGEVVLERKARFDSIYAGTVAQYRIELSQPLTPGFYVADVITTVNGKTEHKTLSFEVANDEERPLSEMLSSGEVLQAAEGESSMPDSWHGMHRRYLYIGLFFLIVIVTWWRKCSDKRHSKKARL